MSNSAAKTKRTPSNQSSVVSKCTLVLGLLAKAGQPVGFADIVERSGLVKSSAHRIMAILVTEGLVEHDAQNKTYRLGPKLISWAMTAWRGMDLQKVAAEELERLRETTGHNVELAVRDGERALYLRTFNSYAVRYAAKAGDHAPLHCTAIGKVLTAFLPPPQQSEILSKLKFERYTENSIRDRNALEVDLAHVKSRGYAICDREEFLQVCGIAAPIFDFEQSLQGGFCVWALVNKADMTTMRGFVPLMLNTAERISERFGYRES